MDFHTWKMAWGLLTAREKKMSISVLMVSLLGAFGQVAMVGSIVPFMNYITGPGNGGSYSFLMEIRSWIGVEDDYRFAVILGLFAVLVIFISNILLLARSYAIAKFGLMRIHTISARLLRSYLGRPYEFFLSRNSGDLGKRILAESNEIASSFLIPAANMISSLLSVVFIIAFLIYVEPVYTIFGAGVMISIYLIVFRIVSNYQKELGERRVNANKVRFTALGEIFGGIKELKTLGREDVFLDKYGAASETAMEAIWKNRFVSESPQFVIQTFFFSSVIMACLAMTSSESLAQGADGVSEMIPVLGTFAFAGLRMVPELQKVYKSLAQMAFGSAAIKNVHEDLSFSGGRSEEDAARFDMSKGITLENVSYSYPGTKCGLSELSFSITKGARVGLVGGTGAGKTTLVDMLLGLFEPTSGTVYVDGTDLSDPRAMRRWRNSVSYVPQEIFLADATIAENIALGFVEDEIDMDKVVECAKTARIHDFIMERTTNGYQTISGERGVMLSGGQRQRIGIARALYRDAEFIVLDEATSALDSRTEKEVMEAIEGLSRQVTIVTIAHRLRTIRNCDQILVLEHGRIVESGSWDDLSSRDGSFSRLVEDSEI